MEKCDNVYFWVECGNRIIFHTIYPEKIWEDFIKSKSDLPGTVLGDIYDHLSRNHAGIKFSDCSASCVSVVHHLSSHCSTGILSPVEHFCIQQEIVKRRLLTDFVKSL